MKMAVTVTIRNWSEGSGCCGVAFHYLGVCHALGKLLKLWVGSPHRIGEGLDWGSGIHYSLKFSPLFISLKCWVIH